MRPQNQVQLAKEENSQRFPENLPAHWRAQLAEEIEKSYFQQLVQFLKREYRSKSPIYPARENVLKALQLVDLPDVKVCILGQDPYHGDQQAIGLSFAVPNSLQPKPPSLKNIFKEMESDLGFHWDGKQSDLSSWAKQGVLLLNTVLSVRRAQAFSHRNKGWENFTDRIIEILAEQAQPIVFVLWGAAAQKKKSFMRSSQHLVIESAHPSPLSAHRGFFGSKPFSKVNTFLSQSGLRPIEWTRICDDGN